MDDDTHPDQLFVAVGRACHEWEMFESELATIYSILMGRPREINAMEDYGNSQTTFARRVTLLDSAAEQFFITRPHQDIEGEIRSLVLDAKRLSKIRNQITHGVVSMIPTIGIMDKGGNVISHPTPHYFLQAPWFSLPKLRNDGLAFIYTSIDVRKHTETFMQFKARASLLAQRLESLP